MARACRVVWRESRLGLRAARQRQCHAQSAHRGSDDCVVGHFPDGFKEREGLDPHRRTGWFVVVDPDVHSNIQRLSVSVLLNARTKRRHSKIPRQGTGGSLFAKARDNSLTILWALTALLSALLATTALLTALASWCLSLLTWFLLTRFLLTALLTALLAAALLLPTHFFVSHGVMLLRGRISAGAQSPRNTVGSLSDKGVGKE